MKKSISLAIALAMMLGLFFMTGCNEGNTEKTEGSEAETTTAAAAKSDESKPAEENKEAEETTAAESEEAAEEEEEAQEEETEDPEASAQAVVEEVEKDEAKLKGKMVWRETGGKTATLNPHMMKTSAEMDTMSYCYGNLLAMVLVDGNYKIIGDHAEGLPTRNEEGTEWTFKIKKGLKWPDGEPITAKTYEYSYKMLLDPKMKNYRAMEAMDQVISVVNAKKYWIGASEDNIKINRQIEDQKKIDEDKAEAEKIENAEEKEKKLAEIQERQDALDANRIEIDEEALKEGGCAWEDVGIKAPDDETLIITLVRPVPEIDFYLQFQGGGSTSPVKQSLYDGGMNEDKTETDYGTSLETMASSGPYILTKWIRDQVKEYERNEDSGYGNEYFNADMIYSRVVEDNTTNVQLFEKGKTDFVGVQAGNYSKYEEDPRLRRTKTTGTWSMFLNMTTSDPEKAFLTDVNFRKALSYATNREAIATKITKKDIPACYVVSSAKIADPDKGIAYRDTPQGESVLEEYPNNGFDQEKAKELFEKAYEKFGKKMVMECLYFDNSEAMKAMGEYLKEQYENLFGKDRFEFKLRAMPWNQCYDMYQQAKYDAGFGSWVGGLFNPWASLDVYKSDFSMKIDQLKSPEFDALWERTVQGDLIFKKEERLDALAEMEKILLDNMPFVPIYEAAGAVLYSDRVELPTDEWVSGVGYAPLQGTLQPLE